VSKSRTPLRKPDLLACLVCAGRGHTSTPIPRVILLAMSAKGRPSRKSKIGPSLECRVQLIA
jgi:hypothetical protein